jgi:hypothetical protein
MRPWGAVAGLPPIDGRLYNGHVPVQLRWRELRPATALVFGRQGWRTTEVSAMRGDERSQEEVIEEFAHYVSPSRVATYRQMGLAMVPGRREVSRIWDWDGNRSFEDGALVSRRSR